MRYKHYDEAEYDYESFIGFAGFNAGEAHSEDYFFEPTLGALSSVMQPMNPAVNLMYTSPIVPAGFFEATQNMNTNYGPTSLVPGGLQGVGSVQDAINILQLSDFIFRV